ncbi:hypothetical protein QN239_20505 [Mycolicibacterium sp. Y3]
MRWVLFGFSLIVGLSLAWGCITFTRGHYLTSAIIFGVMAFPSAVVIALLLVSFGHTRLNVTSDATGFTIRPDRRSTALFFVGIALFIPAGILFVIFTPTGQVDIPMSRGWQIFSPIGMGFGVIAAITGVLSAVRRGGIGYLKLTPTGIVNANIAFTTTHSWDDIGGVAATSNKRHTRKALVLKLRDGGEDVIESADLYTPGGTALFWMMRHYWQNPHDRVELADGRALERLRQQSFNLD